jgi:anti-sigma regulatory factor (Ser/Thr protein kinase)
LSRPHRGNLLFDEPEDTTMPVQVELSLPPRAEAAALARRSLEDLESDLPPEALDSLRLLVSELVTNSVRHGDLSASDRIRLRLTDRGDRIRVEVTDPGDGFGPRPSLGTEPDSPSGWGLFLVSQIADRWGTEENSVTTVWFELPRRP